MADALEKQVRRWLRTKDMAGNRLCINPHVGCSVAHRINTITELGQLREPFLIEVGDHMPGWDLTRRHNRCGAFNI